MNGSLRVKRQKSKSKYSNQLESPVIAGSNDHSMSTSSLQTDSDLDIVSEDDQLNEIEELNIDDTDDSKVVTPAEPTATFLEVPKDKKILISSVESSSNSSCSHDSRTSRRKSLDVNNN